MIIHLGKNPKNGGNPPNDNKLNIIVNLIINLILEKNIWLI